MSGFIPIDPDQLEQGGGDERRDGPPPWEVLLPEGRHHLRVREARTHTSQAGNQSIFVRLEGRDPEGRRAWVDAYVGVRSRGLDHALRALRILDEVRAQRGASDELLAGCVGRWVEVTTGIEPAQNGYPERTRVRYWEGPGQPQDWARQQTGVPQPPPPPGAALPSADDPLVTKIRALPASHRADDQGATGVEPAQTAMWWDGDRWQPVPDATRERLMGFDPDHVPF